MKTKRTIKGTGIFTYGGIIISAYAHQDEAYAAMRDYDGWAYGWELRPILISWFPKGEALSPKKTPAKSKPKHRK